MITKKVFGWKKEELQTKQAEVKKKKVSKKSIIGWRYIHQSGYDFKTGKIKYEVGKTITEPTGHGLYISPFILDTISDILVDKLNAKIIKVQCLGIISKSQAEARCRAIKVLGEVSLNWNEVKKIYNNWEEETDKSKSTSESNRIYKKYEEKLLKMVKIK